MSNLMFTLTLANGSTAEFDSDEWSQINIRRVFWISEVEGATFTVRRGSALLATCTISSGECSFDPDGS